MNFEVQNALTSLDGRTPDFFIVEALSEANTKVKEAAIKVLATVGDEPSAARQLREMLSLY
jgi:hypothetical protein